MAENEGMAADPNAMDGMEAMEAPENTNAEMAGEQPEE